MGSSESPIAVAAVAEACFSRKGGPQGRAGAPDRLSGLLVSRPRKPAPAPAERKPRRPRSHSLYRGKRRASRALVLCSRHRVISTSTSLPGSRCPPSIVTGM